MFKSVVVLIMLLLVGCTTNIATFFPAQPSNEKGSVVYVYRSSEPSSLMLAPEIEIRGAEGKQTNIGTLGNGEYKLVYLMPGQYQILLDAIEYYAPGNKLMVEIKPDTVNYLRLDSSLKFETSLRYKAYVRRYNLQEVEELIALDEIASCIDVDSKPKKKNREAGVTVEDALNKDDDAHFSTDKTADPFSRNP